MSIRISSRRALAVCGAGALIAGAAGCGSSSSNGTAGGASGGSAVNPNGPEVNPAGDIPDNQAYVAYRPPSSTYSVKVPEGWARTASGATTTFTDKLNRVAMQQSVASAPLSTAEAKRVTVAALSKTVAGFRLQKVTSVSRQAGPATLIVYQATSQPDPVTGKTHVDAVERYTFFHKGQRVTLTLSGPKGADNVDPWKIVTDSLRYTA